MLAIYREIQKDQRTSAALTEHLETCSECSELFTQSGLVGERLRSLPHIELPLDAQTKLMQALALEHARFIQRTSPATTPTPAPAFLTPYLNDLLQERTPDSLAAFSTADTGPLPIIRPLNKRRRSYHMSQLAVLGMAATFLMVIMIGGLTSLLIMANGALSGQKVVSLPGQKSNLSVVTPAQISANNYQAAATYPNVASAVADRNTIYYTTYNNDLNSWMLETFDNRTRTSAPLLPTASNSPLIVLTSSKDWLVWLQFDPPKTASGKRGLYETENNLARTWSLHILSLTNNATVQPDGTTSPAAITLAQDTFNPITAPAWATTPVQGVWLTQDTLLAAITDGKGVSHLWSYQLVSNTDNTSATSSTTTNSNATTGANSAKAPVATEIAQAQTNHIFTSPTATSDDKNIYWSDEWVTDQNVLSSNIWTQQIVDATPEHTGRWAAHTVTEKYLFRSDQQSFRPQIVQDTLFILKTNTPAANDSVTVTGTPGTTLSAAKTTTASKDTKTHTATARATTTTTTTTASATAVPTASATATLDTTRIDPIIYRPALDDSVQGTLQAFTANGALPLRSPQEDVRALVSSPQGGSRFLLWQNSTTKMYEMYDVAVGANVNIGTNTIKNPAFMVVNGDTTVWVMTPDPATQQNGNSAATVSFGMFSWPPKVPAN